MVGIHPTAIISAGAKIGAGVSIGPYSIIGEHVVVGAGCSIGPHVVIQGHTTIGERNRFFQFSSIGEIPQDKKYGGEPTRLEIGSDNSFREFCTINVGTSQDQGVTRIGNGNWIMAYVHVAHDCQIGSHTIFANNAQLAGHVRIGDHAILGGFTQVHQFVRVGAHAFTGVGTVLLQDVPPYLMVSGNPAHPHGLNSEGLRRRGFSPAVVLALKRAYKTVYREGLTLEEARGRLRDFAGDSDDLRAFLEFLDVPGRGLLR